MRMSGELGPIDARERLVLMDGLRGLALFGIFLVNLGIMAAPSMAYGPYSLWTSPVSTGVSLARHFLADGAFFFLFSILFGAGFSVMSGRFASRRGGIGLPAYYRRLLLIGLLGWLHVSLFWWGDILMLYALAGALLPFFRKVRDRTLLIWIGVLICGPILLSCGLYGLSPVDPASAAEWAASWDKAIRAWTDALIEGYRSEDFWTVASMRWQEYFYNLWATVFLFPTTLSYMLLGLWLARHDRFKLGERHDVFFRRLLPWIVGVALLGKSLYVYGLFFGGSFSGNLIFSIGSALGCPALGLVYFCAMRRLFRTGAVERLRGGFSAAGRLALSNYLLQSAFASLLFYGYGLGFYGEVGPGGQVLIALVFFAFQAIGSVYWLRCFRMGPLEWCMRKFTYLERFRK